MIQFMQWAYTFVLFLVGIVSLRADDQSCHFTDGNECPLTNIMTDTLSTKSVLIYPGGNTRCGFDDFQADGTNFTSNSTYFFQLLPKHESKKLLIFFQGGGACMDSITCNFELQCSMPKQLFSVNAKASEKGIFNRSVTTNVFNDWNIVHIPYCTGDLHIGDALHEAQSSGLEALFQKPVCAAGKNFTLHQSGYRNTQAVLNWAKTNFPHPDQIIVGGSSAGSLAAQTYSLHVANLWNITENNIRLSILADSYIGILPPGNQAGKFLNYFGLCDIDIGLPQSIVEECKAETLTASSLVAAAMRKLPNVNWLFIDSKGDKIQRFFYELVKQGIMGYPFLNMISPEEFYQNMTLVLNKYKEHSQLVSTFTVEGENHVFLANDNFTATFNTKNESLITFLKDWVNDEKKITRNTVSTTSSPKTSLAIRSTYHASLLWVFLLTFFFFH